MFRTFNLHCITLREPHNYQQPRYAIAWLHVTNNLSSDKVYQLLAHGRWFSPGTSASSTTKTDCHDIAEILLIVALKHQKSNQSIGRYHVDLCVNE
jgi:hypothetical protein